MTLQRWRDYLDEADRRTADSRALLAASELVSATLVAAGVNGEPEIGFTGGSRLYATWYFERGEMNIHLTLQIAGNGLVLQWEANADEYAHGITPVTIGFSLPAEVLAALASMMNPTPSPVVPLP